MSRLSQQDLKVFNCLQTNMFSQCFPHPKGTLLDLRAPGLAGQVRQTVEAREFLDASPDDPIHPNMVPLNE